MKLSSQPKIRMKKISFIEPPPRSWNLALVTGVAVLLLAAISCSTLSRRAVVLPDVPGAKYIGSAECEQCP